MRKIDYSDLRWNGNEYEIYAGYPLGHVSLNAEIDNLEQYREITSGISLDRLREICDAERDGRCVVLPCKVGDTVYHRSGQHTIDDIQLFYPRQNGHVPEERIGKLQIRLGSLNYAGLQTFATYADEIGKTVFLTREEAEAALRKEQSDDEVNPRGPGRPILHLGGGHNSGVYTIHVRYGAGDRSHKERREEEEEQKEEKAHIKERSMTND